MRTKHSISSRKSMILFICLAVLFCTGGAGTDDSNPFQLPDTNSYQTTATETSPTPSTGDGEAAAAQYLNPLTGLPVEEINLLYDPPVMAAVNNPYAKGEATYGLSLADWTFEIYIGDGESRFMPLFYADSIPQYAQIGPLRSGRFAFETIKKHFGGVLVTESSSADDPQPTDENTFNIPAGNGNALDSTFVSPAQMTSFAQNSMARLVFDPAKLYTYAFSTDVPPNGSYAPYLWFLYNKANNAVWWYSDQGTYVRSQYLSLAGKRMAVMQDNLTNTPIACENLILLMADHRVCKDTKYDLDMENKSGAAVIFRDGMMFSANWTTQSANENMPGQLSTISIVDMTGQPFPLKPGRSWVYMLPTAPKITERELTPEIQDLIRGTGSIDPDQLYRKFARTQYGSGLWGVKQYMKTDGMQDQAICSRAGR